MVFSKSVKKKLFFVMGTLGERWGRAWPANGYTTTPGMLPDSAGQYVMSKAVVPTATECLETGKSPMRDYRGLGPGSPCRCQYGRSRGTCKLVWASRHSVAVAPTDFDMGYSLTLPGKIPAGFLHRFAGHTRPQRAPRPPHDKK